MDLSIIGWGMLTLAGIICIILIATFKSVWCSTEKSEKMAQKVVPKNPKFNGIWRKK